ncbi:hypothetical protein CHS0354_009441 [Potamilus streckersoni]|uniref:Major facilitator superfamily (MFS) profile domain-containing protein n=1 Tax=Potamilus streckersoni TaxID=2493646 RepID=A0AAE0WDD6_9BIVA|nr:hypothetical protein CHS0354_009441 [Potamilus streckersoni]
MMISKCQEWSDGGLWGYVVVVSSFMIQVITFGTAQSIGVYNVEFLDYFENSAAAISLVGSINVGIILGSGPIAGLLMNYLSHRQVALIGASISSIGLTCMPFTPNVEYMYFFYGFLTGLGFCLLYVPSHVLCGLYFQRHRSLATGIAISGQGVGGTVFPYIAYILIDTYGWKGSFFIMSGLSLHNFVFAALLRPPSKHIEREIDKLTAPKKVDLLETENNSLDINRIKSVSSYIHIHLEHNHVVYMRNLNDVTPDLSRGETDLPDTVDVHGTDTNKMHIAGGMVCTTFISKIKDQLRKVFIFGFIIYFINNMFWNMGTSTVILFGPEFNINVGLEKEDATIVFTLIGCGTGLGCVLGGLMGNLACCNRMAVYAVANIATGTITLLFPLTFLHTFWGLLILSLLWGLMFGVILGLLMVVTADLLGADALGYGYGYLMLANGFGCSIAPPLAGWLLDVTGKLVPGFLFAGLITILGGLLMALIPLQRRLCPLKDNAAGKKDES